MFANETLTEVYREEELALQSQCVFWLAESTECIRTLSVLSVIVVTPFSDSGYTIVVTPFIIVAPKQ